VFAKLLESSMAMVFVVVFAAVAAVIVMGQ
jgi:hypothetical protein